MAAVSRSAFEERIREAINIESKENGSDSPDFILAAYLADCLDAFDRAIQAREKWYGRSHRSLPLELAGGAPAAS